LILAFLDRKFVILKLKEMKPKNYFFILFAMAICFVNGQSYELGNINSTLYTNSSTNFIYYKVCPIYRTSAPSPIYLSRHNMLYTSTDFSSVGITAGSIIDTIGWFKVDTNNLRNGISAIFKVYIKNSNLAGLPFRNFASAIAGATLVYEDTNFTSSSGLNHIGAWKIPLNTPFVYGGQGLEVLTSWEIRIGPQYLAPYSNGGFGWKMTNTPVYQNAALALNNPTFLSTTLTQSYSVCNMYVHVNGFAANINELNKAKDQISIFPNPTEGITTVSRPKSYELESLQVLDLFGAVLFEQELTHGEQTLDFSALSNGRYTLNVFSKSKSAKLPLIIIH
jgi:Secretion system C-terminal sorting domain